MYLFEIRYWSPAIWYLYILYLMFLFFNHIDFNQQINQLPPMKPIKNPSNFDKFKASIIISMRIFDITFSW